MTSTTASPLWIKSPAFDLSFIFGGAVFTLLLALICYVAPWSIPFFFWMWVFGFEGSHFWATYSRTYFDSKFLSENRNVLTGSLLFFLFPLAAVLLSRQTGDNFYQNLYAFFIFTWSLYHNTRQHFGFVQIYNKKAGADETTRETYRWVLYLVTYAPMSHFFLSYKLKAEMAGGYALVSAIPWVLLLPYALSGLSLVTLLFLAKRTLSERKASPVAALYVGLCWIFYNVMFFGVARLEPLSLAPENFAQTLMVVSIMNSLFHNIQYHAIVWHYSRQRYSGETGAGVFGAAQRINSRFPTYVMAALAFSSLFSLIFWARGEIRLFGALGDGSWGTLAYVLYFGIVGHHFYLDQKIWRVGKSPELGRYFAVRASEQTPAF